MSKPKKHRNKTVMVLYYNNKIKLTTSTYQPYISINRVKAKHKEAILQWCGNSQSYRTLSDKSSECLVN